MTCLTGRPPLLLAALCLGGCIGLWQIDSAREAMRGPSGPAGAVLPAPGDPTPESGAAAASLQDDLWDVYPVVLEIRQDVLLVPAEGILLPADQRARPVHGRRIFHVPD